MKTYMYCVIFSLKTIPNTCTHVYVAKIDNANARSNTILCGNQEIKIKQKPTIEAITEVNRLQKSIEWMVLQYMYAKQ